MNIYRKVRHVPDVREAAKLMVMVICAADVAVVDIFRLLGMQPVGVVEDPEQLMLQTLFREKRQFRENLLSDKTNNPLIKNHPPIAAV